MKHRCLHILLLILGWNCLLHSSILFGQTNESDFHIIQYRYDSLVHAENNSVLKLINTQLKKENWTLGQKAVLTNLKAIFYKNTDKLSLAQQFYFEALELAQKSKDLVKVSVIQNNIGNLFKEIGDYHKAKIYYDQALQNQLKKPSENQTLILTTQLNIGLLKQDEGAFEEGLIVLREGLNSFDDISPKTLATFSLNLGSIFIDLEQFDSAAFYINQANTVYKAHYNLDGYLRNNYHKAYLYELNEQYDSAIYLYKKVYDISHKEEQVETSKDCLEGLMYAHSALKNPDKMMDYYLQINQLNDTINKKKQNKNIYDIESKYQLEKKNQIILEAKEKARGEKQEKTQRTWILSLIAVVILVVSLGIIFIYRQRNKISKLNLKHKNEEIDNMIQEQENLGYQAQIIGENNERKRIAMELHDSIGGLLAAINLHSENLDETHKSTQHIKDLVKESIDEVRSISHNLGDHLNAYGLKQSLMKFAEGISASNKLTVAIFYEIQNIEPTADIATELFKIVRELVTNALKHAKADTVNIQLSDLDGNIQLMYDDNGIGFDLNTSKRGLGLESIYNRIDKLSGTVEIDSQLLHGTTITIQIPEQYD